jgi:hypothetical protein
VNDHGGGGAAHVFLGIAGAEIGGLGQRESLGDVAVERIVGTGLIGDYVDLHAAAHDFRKDVGTVADETDGDGFLLAHRVLQDAQGFVEGVDHEIAVSSLEPFLDALCINVNPQKCGAGHGGGEWLRSTHPAHAAADDQLSF